MKYEISICVEDHGQRRQFSGSGECCDEHIAGETSFDDVIASAIKSVFGITGGGPKPEDLFCALHPGAGPLHALMFILSAYMTESELVEALSVSIDLDKLPEDVPLNNIKSWAMSGGIAVKGDPMPGD